jgi:hypothetical protein
VGKLKFTIFRDFILNIDPTSNVVLCHIGILPLSSLSTSHGGSVFFQSTNHRSVLNKQDVCHSKFTRQIVLYGIRCTN